MTKQAKRIRHQGRLDAAAQALGIAGVRNWGQLGTTVANGKVKLTAEVVAPLQDAVIVATAVDGGYTRLALIRGRTGRGSEMYSFAAPEAEAAYAHARLAAWAILNNVAIVEKETWTPAP
jgi:hypothetical protein